jgi:calcineurin-like phosphoesterase family protein
MIFFTSDHHFNHHRICDYAFRPFSSVDEMDEAMIQRWNDVVKRNDVVYHLGDFTLNDNALPYLSRLNGNIHFVVPDFHHDQRWLKNRPLLKNVTYLPPIYALNVNKENVIYILCHYPMAIWDRQHYGAWHLHGHIHNKEFTLPGFAMNVNVEFHNYYPVSYDEVKMHMINLGWYPGWKAEYIK